MIAILIIPVVTAFICYVLRNARLIGYVSLAGTAALALYAYPTVAASISAPVAAMGGAFSMDALSGYIMAIVICLSLASAIYSISYLERRPAEDVKNRRSIKSADPVSLKQARDGRFVQASCLRRRRSHCPQLQEPLGGHIVNQVE